MQIENAISSERIIIRDYFNTDLPFVTSMWFDKDNGKYLSDPTRDFVDDIFQKALDGMENNPEGYYLVIESKDKQCPIGSCFMFPDAEKKSYEIGYCIHKEHWEQGYGSEAVRLIKTWILRHGGNEITAEVAKENLASNLLLKKLGFKIIRESKFEKYKMNIHYESYIYRLALN